MATVVHVPRDTRFAGIGEGIGQLVGSFVKQRKEKESRETVKNSLDALATALSNAKTPSDISKAETDFSTELASNAGLSDELRKQSVELSATFINSAREASKRKRSGALLSQVLEASKPDAEGNFGKVDPALFAAAPPQTQGVAAGIMQENLIAFRKLAQKDTELGFRGREVTEKEAAGKADRDFTDQKIKDMQADVAFRESELNILKANSATSAGQLKVAEDKLELARKIEATNVLEERQSLLNEFEALHIKGEQLKIEEQKLKIEQDKEKRLLETGDTKLNSKEIQAYADRNLNGDVKEARKRLTTIKTAKDQLGKLFGGVVKEGIWTMSEDNNNKQRFAFAMTELERLVLQDGTIEASAAAEAVLGKTTTWFDRGWIISPEAIAETARLETIEEAAGTEIFDKNGKYLADENLKATRERIIRPIVDDLVTKGFSREAAEDYVKELFERLQRIDRERRGGTR